MEQNFPMISVDRALSLVLEHSSPLGWEDVSVMESCGRVLAETVTAVHPFPAFRTSVMDGYAVQAPLNLSTHVGGGIYSIVNETLAGDARVVTLSSDSVSYITTGAKVPDNVCLYHLLLFICSCFNSFHLALYFYCRQRL